jgi:acyl-CoA synthetase (AMP-forming)/AMP-acid ligase II
MTIETLEQLLARESALVTDGIRLHAKIRPNHPALIIDEEVISYRQFDALLNQVAHTFKKNDLQVGDVVAICAATSLEYLAVFFGAIRYGAVIAPMSPSASAKALEAMMLDAAPTLTFIDTSTAPLLETMLDGHGLKTVCLDSPAQAWRHWLSDEASEYTRPAPQACDPINIIYSSGTTGVPKGIVHPVAMRWVHSSRRMTGIDCDSTLLSSTPLYSNTTLVALYAALTRGATTVVMKKFDVRSYLELAQTHKATHTMLVPVQYQRFMNFPDFDTYDLSSFRQKFCTSAPFSKALKQALIARWPGDLIETFGMTEGGGVFVLEAHKYPDKLHTVGKPSPESEMKLLDEQGNEVAPGQVGEVAGHSVAMMLGYKNQDALSKEIEWFSPEGKRFLKSGDIGKFDEDGFFVLMARRKEMIISGGFNIYPSDLEAELHQHDNVLEAAVVGMHSEEWGEIPVAFVVVNSGEHLTETDLLDWVNARLGKMQRIKKLCFLDQLPRSSIGKVLKKELHTLTNDM